MKVLLDMPVSASLVDVFRRMGMKVSTPTI
jgi:hypothetical protein